MIKVIDSCIWVSYFLEIDSKHLQAVKIIDNIGVEKILITDHILLEVTTILLQKKGKESADLFITLTQSTQNLDIIYTSKKLFYEYMHFFTKNDFVKLSFIDQSLLYLSQDFEIITFDKELLKAIKHIGNS